MKIEDLDPNKVYVHRCEFQLYYNICKLRKDGLETFQIIIYRGENWEDSPNYVTRFFTDRYEFDAIQETIDETVLTDLLDRITLIEGLFAEKGVHFNADL